MADANNEPTEEEEEHSPPDKSDLGLEQFDQIDDEQGISLDELSSAYAEMMGGEDPFSSTSPSAATSELEEMLLAEDDEDQEEGADEDEEEDDEVTPLGILEAMLFVGDPENQPLTSRRVAALMRGVPPNEVDELVVELNETYEAEGRPYEIVSADAGYRMVLRQKFAPLRNSFYGKVREARLSQPAVDILAIIAYNPGMQKKEIDELRGKPSGAVLTQLIRRGLLRMERPAEKPRRPCYYPTDRFLQLFGLQSLAELPRSE